MADDPGTSITTPSTGASGDGLEDAAITIQKHWRRREKQMHLDTENRLAELALYARQKVHHVPRSIEHEFIYEFPLFSRTKARQMQARMHPLIIGGGRLSLRAD
jgi:hypothetical protein